MATLRVAEVFESVQGEGWWSGMPMTFVRLAGCNAHALGLWCTEWCDTSRAWATEAASETSAAAVLEQVRLPRLCLTGGEPLLQPEGVVELVTLAKARNVKVHLETNGTVSPPECAFDWAVVSPKPPEYRVAPGWEGRVQELKMIVDDYLDVAVVERLARLYPEAVVSIQPLWAGPDCRHSEKYHKRAVQLVLDHPVWRLSLQIHKMLGLP
ncbi:MAG: 7-carboxy-7-deazaguanine synthase QueE [Thermoleophilia bacterium]|nr:7-carboxy-7-deazaguanine synthase QueE [Thermoleophilia bacterium]